MSRRLPEGELPDRELAAWIDLDGHLEAKGAARLTRDNYGWALVQLQDYLRAHHGGMSLLDITHTQVNGYLSWLREHGGRMDRKTGRPGRASADTVDTRYRALRRCWRYWLAAGYVAENIFRPEDQGGLVAVPVVPPKLVPVVEQDTAARLLSACEGREFDSRRDLALLRLALTPGGPRASELCGLRMSDVDLRGGVVLIHGKGGKDRLIAPGPATRQALARYLAARAGRPDAGTTDRVFLGQRGPLTRSGLQQMLARRSQQIGLTRAINPHRLRHTIAATCKANKMDQETAKLLFGWSTDVMYARYGRSAAAALAVQHGRELAARLEVA